MRDPRPRRTVLQLGAATAAAAAATFACRARDGGEASPPAPVPPAPSSSSSVAAIDRTVVRLASVPTAVEGNVLPSLVGAFEQASGTRVELTASDDVYGRARAGGADLVISHYGHKHAEAFVMDGFGEFPRTLFSNQMALVGPRSDPAKVRGLTDVAEAFRRIAATRSPFVVNGIDGVRYLVEILWNAAGKPPREGWYLDAGRKKDEAILEASRRGAYAFWGLTPFLRLDAKEHVDLEPLVLGDPLLQRMLVAVVARPEKLPGVNVDGARALQNYLLAPATQARIRAVRYPGRAGEAAVFWVPAGRHNRTAILPRDRT